MLKSGFLNWFLIAVAAAIGLAVGRNITGRLGIG